MPFMKKERHVFSAPLFWQVIKMDNIAGFS